jgi:aspartate-semialdehyde dehydrogenase
MKVMLEMRKVFNEPELAVSCTAVRVPTIRAHAEAITIETDRPVSPKSARAVLEKAPGVRLVDDVANDAYPMPITAGERYDVDVGRIRTSLIFGAHGLDLFVCGDQLLKGAALNAVQIAEKMV